jgi:hypothetical protein
MQIVLMCFMSFSLRFFLIGLKKHVQGLPMGLDCISAAKIALTDIDQD